MNNESLPDMDDVQNNGQSEQDLLDAVMRNSPIMEDAVPLPNEEETFDDPVESDEEDPVESDEVVSEDDEEEVEEYEEEDVEADDESTQSDIYTTDDLDLDALVSVKIDGEDTEVSFGDLVKGYSTEQSLSKKGRELGEARKALEEERATKLAEIDQIAVASAGVLSGAEQGFAKEYHDIEAKIQKARDDGDTYELGELKDKREQAQSKYWGARRQREELMENVQRQKAEYEQQQFAVQIEQFQQSIPDLIPDFDDKVAGKIREFALEKGIAEGLLDGIVDPNIVKFIDDYRRLSQGVSKGAAKRKKAPAKKALPTKKAPAVSKKKADAAKMRKARAFKDGASESDQMDFLRDYASNSLNNL